MSEGRDKDNGEKEGLNFRRAENAETFLKQGSETALTYFREERPMTEEGFELCVREMLRLGCNRLYFEFCDKYRSFMIKLEQRADRILKESRNRGMTFQEKKRLRNKICDAVAVKERQAGDEK